MPASAATHSGLKEGLKRSLLCFGAKAVCSPHDPHVSATPSIILKDELSCARRNVCPAFDFEKWYELTTASWRPAAAVVLTSAMVLFSARTNLPALAFFPVLFQALSLSLPRTLSRRFGSSREARSGRVIHVGAYTTVQEK